MKKSFFAVVLITILVVTSGLVQADTPSPTPVPILTQIPIIGSQPRPGQNCGNVKQGNTVQPDNRCCFYAPLNIVNLPKPIGIIPDQLMDAINSAIQQIIKPIVDPVSRIAQQAVQPCLNGTPSTPGHLSDPSCICTEPHIAALTALANLCVGVADPNACNSCLNQGKVYTALGCIPATVKEFIEDTLLGWGIGLAGIVSLLCIIYAAFRIQTSRGNPEGIKKAQELLTSCIMGLMLIIFSIFILRLIGVDILKIPGFK